MILSNVAIDRRITVFVLLLLIVVSGGYSYWVLPREDNPEVIIPVLIVTTIYEGVAPEDMESLVTVPIERKLTGLSGVKTIESTSSEGVSVIIIEFVADEDIDVAHQRVRDKVDQARQDLPDEIDDPSIEEVNISELPIMYISLMAEEGMSKAVLTDYAENLEEDLETIKGVLDVEVIGGVEREIQIIVDPDRAAGYGISLADLVVLARVENVNHPAGTMDLGDAKFSVRVPGEFTSAAEIENLLVKGGPDGNVYIRDIAVVCDDFKDIETLSRVNGTPAVTLTVSKRAGENIIHIADNVRAHLAVFENLMLPGMQAHVTMDTSDDIRAMVTELQNNIISGLILVLIVIFIFLGFYNAIMVALAIPISMLITFVVLYITDTTLNMVVLFSLILALGMLVDNGIVVVENIYRHVQAGLPLKYSAKKGAGEVAWPIIASTFTTIAAFSPMFFWPGIWGSFMYYLPLTVCTALIASLFVGLIVNPALASVFMRKGRIKKTDKSRKHHLIVHLYERLLRLALQWRLITITVAVVTLVVIIKVFSIDPVIEFVPDTEPSRAYINIDCAEGTALSVTDAIVREVEIIANEYSEHTNFIIANVGSRGVNRFGGNSGSTSHIGRVTLDFPRLEDMSVKPSEIIEDIRTKISGITGGEIRVEKEGEGPSDDPPVNVELSGDNFTQLAQLAVEIANQIENVPNLVDLRDDYEAGKPELQINVDREQALLLGLNTDFIGLAMTAAIKGRKAGEYREGDEEYDVTVRFPKTFREDLTRLESMTLVNLNNTLVPFSSVARIEPGAGYGVINRIDRKRTVTVMADTDGLRPGAEVLKDVRAILENYTLPPTVSISFTGQNEEQEESQVFLRNAFIVALFLIVLVLITQFNSLLQPLIIMSSVILSLAGVFLGLLICDMPFGVIMTGIGCISLAGVVVNNAIVLIDFINQLRHQGKRVQEAIIEAGVTRFRPVMLTAVTTILGLIPMATGVSYDFLNGRWIVGGESSQWWGSMAVAVIFGLAFATLLTLIVVPTLYSILAGFHEAVYHEEQ